jgi:hypothetical protein
MRAAHRELRGEAGSLERAREDEQADEQHEQAPVHLAVDLLRLHPPRQQGAGGPTDRHHRDRHPGEERQQHHADRDQRLRHQGIVHDVTLGRGVAGEPRRELPPVHEPDDQEHARQA